MTEPKEKLDRLRAKRGGHRGVCTKLAKEADELLHLPGDVDIDRSEIIRSLLEAKLKILSEIDEEILGLCDVEDIEQEIEESAEVVSRILNAKRKLEKALKPGMSKGINKGDGQLPSHLIPTQQDGNSNSTHSTNGDQSNGTSQNEVNTDMSQPIAMTTTSTTTVKPKLPKLTLPKFKGDVTKWNTFWDSYESAIHNNDNITKVDKFNYLNSLLEGTALRAIQGLTLTNANYDAAVEILQDRFGRPQQVITAHMDEILKIQACTGERLSSLRYVYDKISVHVRGLASLGVSSEQYGSLLIPIIMSKLPSDIRLQIARKATKEAWKIDDLLSTIKFEIEAREISEGTKSSGSNQQGSKHQGNNTKTNNTPTASAMFVKSGKLPDNSQMQCVYCSGYHYSASCEKIVSSEARKKILGESGRCFNCIRKGHNAKDCVNTRKCRHCQGKHHQSICLRNQKVESSQPTETVKEQPKTEETTTAAIGICKGTVLLQTARANATNGPRSTPVRVLFDTGSQRSYITNSTQAKLKLEPIKKETLYLNTFGDNKCKRQNCEVYKFNIENKNGSEEVEITAINFPIICSPLNSKVNTNYTHLEGLELADFGDDVDDSNTIDILIGSDYYWDIVTGDVVKGESGPTAVSSKLGWLLSGRVQTSDEPEDPTVSNLILTGESLETSGHSTAPKSADKIVDSLRRFWETESIGINNNQREHDEDVNFIRDIRFTGERYEVHLPWKEECHEIGADYELCHSRLRSLHHKLTKQPELLREYDKGIQEQLISGVIEQVPHRSKDSKENENNVHYLPHHGVVRKDKATTKLRVVYNGSATTASRTRSLNDCLLTGPNYIPHLFNILVKFRVNPVGLVADIEKAFLMVGIDEVDRDMLRFLWFKNVHDLKSEIVEYRFCRLVFGLRPSPAILGSTIDHHLHFYNDQNPEIVDILKNSLYVDDLVSGAQNDDKAFNIYKVAKKIMLEGGFNLRKWNSNSSTLVEMITNVEKKVESSSTTTQPPVMEEDLSYAKASIGQQPNATEDKLVKVLGILWDTDSDEFVFSLSALATYARSLPTTKRTVLKVTAKVFDPIGFLTPFTIKMKALFQDLCTEKLDWDDELDGNLQSKWNTILSELDNLDNVRIPRCYNTSTPAPTKIELHGFSDASQTAFAAVVYWRAVYDDGHVEVKLVASKTKVAPLKKQTIPRLELLGATILARLINTLRNCLSTNQDIEIFNWTDSKAVLCWITNDKPWNQYVQRRVQEIRQLTPKTSWRFCPGSQNPADFPSRGIQASNLVSNSAWWSGPEYLYKPQCEWPKDPAASSSDESALKETIKNPPTITRSLASTNVESVEVNLNVIINCDSFSSFARLLRVTAYVLKFVNKLKVKRSTNNAAANQNTKSTTSELTAQELDVAESLWIRSIQSVSFSKEIEFLKSKSNGLPPARVRQFGLYFDGDQVIRCKGRINNANLPPESKNPTLLPPKHSFIDLLVLDVHNRVKHNGIRDTLTTIRERFWILRGRETVKRIIKGCVVCKKAEGVPFQAQPSPDLPSSRVSDEPPFTNVGLDFAGPMFIRGENENLSSSSSSKTYILLFTCASTRAVHLELTQSLDVPSFLRAFRRFASRRGLPSLLLSDNAKTFKGACKEICKLNRAPEVWQYLTNNRITWRFITEKAPWWGGFWERLVRSIKRPLKKTIGRTSLTYDELSTILIEVEGLINARPITYIFDDEESISYPLCPSHLIYGRRITAMPSSEHYEVVSTYYSLTKRARHQRKLLQQFTKQWRKEYLQSLREQSSKSNSSKNIDISVGDIVILKNDQTCRNFWKLAKIEQLLQGDDGVVRAVIVKVLGGKGNDKVQLLRRSIEHLIPVEVKSSTTEINDAPTSSKPEDAVPSTAELSTGRPRRNAAVVGELRRLEQMRLSR